MSDKRLESGLSTVTRRKLINMNIELCATLSVDITIHERNKITINSLKMKTITILTFYYFKKRTVIVSVCLAALYVHVFIGEQDIHR